ncbi:MAG: hypothetical protein IT385_05795 [Deltaproteobacteria bacterium]|nr:hypothetical protein [Deltaproteobacteria bacterium]
MKFVMLLCVGVVLVACKEEPAAEAPSSPSAAAPGAAPREIDLTDNPQIEQLARDALQAYRDKNIERLAELGPAGAKQKTIFIEPRNPRYEELLGDGSWRMQSLRAWDGKTLAKVERGIDVAFAWYHQDDAARYGIELRKDDGRWAFHDLVQRPLPKAGAGPSSTP